MKAIWLVLITTVLSACASINEVTTQKPAAAADAQTAPLTSSCKGDTALPANLAGKFSKVKDEQLLASAIGKLGEGKLCQGQVYQANADVVIPIFRAWNSTNPSSQFGSWWAATKPTGSVAQYREDYEICYQWSPLDVLTQCQLQAGTKIVIGTGQSAVCSKYLTYPVSAAKQLYIENAKDVVENCQTATGQFSWQ